MEQPVDPEPQLAGDARLPAFATMARRGEPPFDELLLALAGEFRWVDRPRALERLDELGRQLFGLAVLEPGRRAERLATVLGSENGFEATRLGSATVFLDQVLQSGRGHPALLAVVYLEAARRAGVELVLYSCESSWYVGASGARELVLVGREEPFESDELSGPAVLQSHCSHELAYGILEGLAGVYLRLGRSAPAERALQLRNLLPVHPSTFGP